MITLSFPHSFGEHYQIRTTSLNCLEHIADRGLAMMNPISTEWCI